VRSSLAGWPTLSHEGRGEGGYSLGYGMVASPIGRMLEVTPVCDDLISLADGELDGERAAVFRVHLATCEPCQNDLLEAMQLSARLSDLAPRKHS
jgi:Putative zinc-finger